MMWATVEDNSIVQSMVQDLIYEAPFFKTEAGCEVGLSHLFYVKIKNENDSDDLYMLASENDVEVLGFNEWMPQWYTLACTKESTGNALQMANMFYETGLFEASQPDLMSDDTPQCVDDPYFSQQWALRNTGQYSGTPGVDIGFCNARAITQGSSSIIVAVVDQGIQLNHTDLNVYPLSYDTHTGRSQGELYGSHGTCCAGIISAKTNNAKGIAGIAPNYPVMSVSNNLLATPDSRQKRADGINWAWRNGASVISNSWGSAVQYQVINDAISLALTSGRSGKGCVVCFAAGNERYSTVGYPARCNADILAVGAILPNGRRAEWSQYGTALDVVAPGDYIPTTTTGGGYTTRFDGTSAACPHVAGIAALILSVNPNLTQKEVADIIEKTATKVGGYNYANTSGRTNGTRNLETGYGLVNAYEALNAAAMTNDNSISFVLENDRHLMPETDETRRSGINVFGYPMAIKAGLSVSFNRVVNLGASLTAPDRVISYWYELNLPAGQLITDTVIVPVMWERKEGLGYGWSWTRASCHGGYTRFEPSDYGLEEPYTDDQCYVCLMCAWTYDPAKGSPALLIPPGVPFKDIVDQTQLCSFCGQCKSSFAPLFDSQKFIHVCGWIYDPALGFPEFGIPPGTPWKDIDDNAWVCGNRDEPCDERKLGTGWGIYYE